MDYDLIVVGGGAAGLGAARTGVERGARTLLVSDGEPGGDCTFHGCVPSKTLIESARKGVPFPTATARVREVVAEIAATENAEVLRGEGIDVHLGRARLLGRQRMAVDGRELTAAGIVLATGSVPSVPPVAGLDAVPYLTNMSVFDLTRLPESLVVLGGGSTGCELAQAFARFGTQVTVVEMAGRLLPGEEPAASAVVAEVFAREGIDVCVGVRAERAGESGDEVNLVLDSGYEVSGQRLLVATGRAAVTGGLGLDEMGVRLDGRGNVVTDDRLATTARGVFAAGDVTGRLRFTHAAFEMGRIAARNALSRRKIRYRPAATPWVTFTEPEVARVGVTEAEAAAAGGGRVAYLPMREMDRAITAAETDGFVQLLAGPRRLFGNFAGGRVLGATVVAARAGELIHEPALAMATGMFTGRLAAATHAYPTWSYGVQLTAAQFFTGIGGRRARPVRDTSRPES